MSQLKDESAKANEALEEFRKKMSEVTDADLLCTFQVMHQGDPASVITRFLKAREYNVPKAHKMLMECLRWRVKNDVDDILSRPMSDDKWMLLRKTQLMGLSGYDHSGKPVFGIRVGLSMYDGLPLEHYVHAHIQMNEYRDQFILPEASQRMGHSITSGIKILDMTGLKLTALSRVKILTALSSIDDLNYPEKSDIYFIVNTPYVFSTCWKAVKPLLQERTKLKVRVLQGNGREELLKHMDESALPDFCRSASGKDSDSSVSSASSSVIVSQTMQDPTACCSPLHPFHKKLRELMAKQVEVRGGASHLISHGSFEYSNEIVESEDMTKLGKAVENVLISGGGRSSRSDSISDDLSSKNGTVNGATV